MQMSFCPATENDIEAIFELNKWLIDTYEDIASIEYEKVLAWVGRKIQANIGEYRRIFADGEHAGYVFFHPEDDGMELDDLYVFPKYQGRGIGMRTVELCCLETPLPVTLYVFCKNEGAVRLYERLGFRKTARIHDTRWLMRRENNA